MPVCYSKDTSGLEESLNHIFKNRALLLEALTHRSYYHENPDKAGNHNERLEFLGDSVLGLAIVEYLFNYDKGMPESLMSKIKSYLVRGSVLAEIGAEMSLGRYLRLGKGEEDTGGRSRKSIIANAVEALFGAVYIEAGYAPAREIILRLFDARIKTVITSKQYCDYKTDLQEKSQTLFGVLPEYKLVSQKGDEHLKTFTIEVHIKGERFGSGQGRSKKEAGTLAAKEALEKLTVT